MIVCDQGVAKWLKMHYIECQSVPANKVDWILYKSFVDNLIIVRLLKEIVPEEFHKVLTQLYISAVKVTIP